MCVCGSVGCVGVGVGAFVLGQCGGQWNIDKLHISDWTFYDYSRH